VKLIGSHRSITVSGDAFASAMRLRDSWWRASGGQPGESSPSPSPSSTPTLPLLPGPGLVSPPPR
jgi:hypothetical protein